MTRAILFRVCTIAATLAALPALPAAQTVEDLVARHIEARGGIERIRAVQTLKITRTVAAGIGGNIRVIVYRKRPDLFRAEQGQAASGAPLTPRGVNADEAWDTIQGKVVTRSEPLEAETREIDADFDGLLVNWKEKGHTVTYEGREAQPGGDVFTLKVRTKSGVERTVFLDAVTYLERRHTGVLTLPNGRKFDVVIDFSNWRDVNGVKFPFDITEDRTGGGPAQSFVTYTEKIEANVPIDDSLFATPRSGQ